MRGRTNITQRSGIAVHGDVITAIAVDNIGIGDFVEYELVKQIKELLNVNFPLEDLTEDVRVVGDLVYVRYLYAIYVIKKTGNGLSLVSVFNDFFIYTFEVVDSGHLIVAKSFTNSSVVSSFVILEENNGILSVFSEYDPDFSASRYELGFGVSENTICAVRAYDVKQTSGSFKGFFDVYEIDCSDLGNLQLVSTTKLSADYPYVGGVNRVIFKNGYLVVYYSSGVSTNNYYKILRTLTKQEDRFVVKKVVTTTESFNMMKFATPHWIICGVKTVGYDYNNTSTVYAHDLKIYNAESLQPITISLKTVGFDKGLEQTTSRVQRASILSISSINETTFFVGVVLKDTLGSGTHRKIFNCAILEFDPVSANFTMISNLLDLSDVFPVKSNDYVLFVDGSYYVQTKETSQIDYVQLIRTGNTLSLEKNENKVKKYSGGTAIGFSKRSAKTGDEIQVYIPPQS